MTPTAARPANLASDTRMPHVAQQSTRQPPGTFQDRLQITAATRLLRDGVAIEVVSAVLGHASITTTLEVYGHLTSEDARRVLEAAGWFAGRRVSW